MLALAQSGVTNVRDIDTNEELANVLGVQTEAARGR